MNNKVHHNYVLYKCKYSSAKLSIEFNYIEKLNIVNKSVFIFKDMSTFFLFKRTKPEY